VTQWFHLDRVLYTCDRLGIGAVGVAADRRDYYLARFWWWRELMAVTRAWLDLNLLHPTPVLGEKLPIFWVGSQQLYKLSDRQIGLADLVTQKTGCQNPVQGY